MKNRYVWILGVLLLGVVLFMRPMASAAAETVATSATAGQGTQQLTQACIDTHKLPAAEQGQAMNKMMNDPNLIGAMNQMMNGAAGSMMNGAAGSMMGGWQNSQNGGK